MNTIQNIDVNRIDPDSIVNVRRQGVEENVEKVKASIQEHGYWPDQPIIIRPHPDSNSKYDYQNVTGQCRLKACLALGLAEIPAFILELDDNEAIQRSWLENEVRGDLTLSDKTYWANKIYSRFNGDGYDSDEAFELAAKYLGVKVPTVRHFCRLAFLPDIVKDWVDKKILTQQIADVIATNTIGSGSIKQVQQAMEERASWILTLDRDNRDHAVKALQRLGNKATIAELNTEVMRRSKESQRIVQYVIPSELHDELLQWGEERGLDNEQEIVGKMVGETLRR